MPQNRADRRRNAKANGQPMAPGKSPVKTQAIEGEVQRTQAITNKAHHYRLVPAGEATQMAPDGSEIKQVLFHLISEDGNLLAQTKSDPDGKPQPIVIAALPYIVNGSGIVRNPFLTGGPIVPGNNGPKLIV